MDSREQGRVRDGVQAIAGVALVLLGGLLAALALSGTDLADARAVALPVAAIAVLAGLVSSAAWWQERREREHIAGEAAVAVDRLIDESDRAGAEQEELRAELEARIAERDREIVATRDDAHAARQELERRSEQQERELEERRREHENALEERERAHSEQLDKEQEELERLRQVRDRESEWNRELRRQIAELHREHGALGDVSDIKQLVLRMAVVLVEADKGILLSRVDEDGDGSPLDVVAHEGFDSDPADSAVAHAFASEVIEADKTLREDDSRAIDREGRTDADDEIDNLVAIPIYIADEFSGVVVCANRDGGFEELDDDVLLALGDHAGAVLENQRLHGRLRSSYLSTVAMLAEVIEAKDPFLRGHSDEVSRYVSAVADRLGMETRRREQLVFGSLLHDVGKVGISERILLKPAALTPEERSVIQLHPRIGYRLIERVPALRDIAPAILHHHERYDGEGYPSRLAGEEIPLEARIVCVADSFSAMTAERPYRPRMSLEDACAELERCAGTQFDPEVVRVFVEEVRSRPIVDHDEAVAAALAHDPELQTRRSDGEPLLGQGPLAVTDNLTLLYSHRYFHEVAAKEAELAHVQDASFAVVLVEPADIAEINRTEGYAAGDVAIRAVAAAVQRVAVRAGGTACRHGGTRLGLIVRGADSVAADRLASELAAEVGDAPRVTCGAAAWRPGESGDDVVARARLAMGRLTRVPAS
jgi:diguanylate cyclase (GGDEF)-like protein